MKWNVSLLLVFTLFVPACGNPSKKGDNKKQDAPAEKKDDAGTKQDPKPDDPKTASHTGDCNQWGGTPQRNNVRDETGIPSEWSVGEFDLETGEWKNEGTKNIKWAAKLGSQSYGNPAIRGVWHSSTVPALPFDAPRTDRDSCADAAPFPADPPFVRSPQPNL